MSIYFRPSRQRYGAGFLRTLDNYGNTYLNKFIQAALNMTKPIFHILYMHFSRIVILNEPIGFRHGYTTTHRARSSQNNERGEFPWKEEKIRTLRE